jgi:hypothetical protein
MEKNMGRVYVLTIPSWNAVIPPEWPLEISIDGKEFAAAGGTTIALTQGALLRGGPDELIERMVEHNYIREITEE